MNTPILNNKRDQNIKYIIILSSLINTSALLLSSVILYKINTIITFNHDITNILNITY